MRKTIIIFLCIVHPQVASCSSIVKGHLMNNKKVAYYAGYFSVITRPAADAPPAALNLNRILTGRASRLSRGGAVLLIVLTHQLSLP